MNAEPLALIAGLALISSSANCDNLDARRLQRACLLFVERALDVPPRERSPRRIPTSVEPWLPPNITTEQPWARARLQRERILGELQ